MGKVLQVCRRMIILARADQYGGIGRWTGLVRAAGKAGSLRCQSGEIRVVLLHRLRSVIIGVTAFMRSPPADVPRNANDPCAQERSLNRRTLSPDKVSLSVSAY